jgi:hypothetical protein
MQLLAWLLSLCAAACALGWICGVRWCDVGFVVALGLALPVAPGEGRAG